MLPSAKYRPLNFSIAVCDVKLGQLILLWHADNCRCSLRAGLNILTLGRSLLQIMSKAGCLALLLLTVVVKGRERSNLNSCTI